MSKYFRDAYWHRWPNTWNLLYLTKQKEKEEKGNVGSKSWENLDNYLISAVGIWRFYFPVWCWELITIKICYVISPMSSPCHWLTNIHCQSPSWDPWAPHPTLLSFPTNLRECEGRARLQTGEYSVTPTHPLLGTSSRYFADAFTINLTPSKGQGETFHWPLS